MLHVTRISFLIILLSITTRLCSGTCSKGCIKGDGGISENELLKLTDGNTYTYEFKSKATIALKQDDNEAITTRILGQALITYQSDCLYLLRLRNIQLSVPTSKKQSTINNIEKPVTFSINDGIVNDEICVEGDDTQSSLNIKRAVISLFQANLKGHYETDVFGRCPTEVTTRTDGDLITVTKSRFLNTCSYREHIKQEFIMTKFDFNSDMKSSPLLDSKYMSEQKFKNGVLEYAKVTEDYEYFPFRASDKNGAKAHVVTQLKFLSNTKEAIKVTTDVKKSIIFETPHPVTSTSSTVDAITKALQETLKTMKTSVSDNSAKTFGQLLRIMRHSTKNDILTVYGQIKAGAGFIEISETKKVFLDALFKTGTGEAIEVAIELLKNNALDTHERLKLCISLTMVQHVTPGALSAVASIVAMDSLPNHALLGAGVLAGKYCRDHACDKVAEIDTIAEKLVQLIQDSKADNKKQENRIVATLKALGNMKAIPEPYVSKVVDVAENAEHVSIRVRVAALETLEKNGCNKKIKESALKLLRNIQEDSEIRIKAYLVLVQCPCNHVSMKLKEILETEPSYQVGSFITTHLHTIRNSANHDKEHVRHYLGTIHPPKHYPIDFTRYSFNNEYSTSFSGIGAGSSLESNVIYSPKSFLARSAKLNVTVQLFGHLVNLLEVGIRQENMEKILEQYFGPMGYLKSKLESNDVLEPERKSLLHFWKKIHERFNKSFRSKRELNVNDVNEFNKGLKYDNMNKLDHDFDLDISLKMFGNDLLFLNWNEKTTEPEVIVDRVFDKIDKVTDRLKDLNFHYKNHLPVMDFEFSYPTSGGFALKFSAEAVATVHFLTTANVDIKQWLKDPNAAQAKFSLIPSANVDISGQLSIDSEVYETGLMVSTSMLSSTGFDVNYRTIEDGKGFDLKFGLPVDEQVLLSVSNEVVFNTREIGKKDITTPVKSEQKGNGFEMCNSDLSILLGLTFCLKFDMPHDFSSQMWLSPMKMAVKILRKDLTHYHLRAVYNDKKEGERKFDLVFNTPASKTNRKIHLSHVLNRNSDSSLISFTNSLQSQFGNFQSNFYLKNMADEKSLEIVAKSNEIELLMKLGAKIVTDDKKRVYSPIFLIKSSKHPELMNAIPIHFDGKLIVEGDREWTALKKIQLQDTKLILKNQPPILINGNGKLHIAANDYSMEVKVSRESNYITLKSSLNRVDNKLEFALESENSMNPQTNLRLNTKISNHHDTHDMDVSLTLVYGPDLESKTNRLTFQHQCSHNFDSLDTFMIDSKNSLKLPALQLEAMFDINAKSNFLKTNLFGKYDKLELKAEFQGELHKKTPGDYVIMTTLSSFGNSLKVHSSREVIDGGKGSKILNEIRVNDVTYTLSGNVNHFIDKNKKSYEFGTDLQMVYSKKADQPIRLLTSLKLINKNFGHLVKIERGKSVLYEQKIDYDLNKNIGSLVWKIDMVIDAKGSIQGDGNALLKIDLLNLKRAIELNGKITNQRPKFDLLLKLSHNFGNTGDSAPMRVMFTIDSRNLIEVPTLVKSTNKIDWAGNLLNTKLNLAGNQDGRGYTKMEVFLEAELTNKNYGAVQISRDMTYQSGKINGKTDYSLVFNKNKSLGKGVKLQLKAEYKDIDLKKGLINVDYKALVESEDRKLFDGIFKMNRVTEEDGNNRKTHIILKGSGEVVPKDLSVTYDGDHRSNSKKYQIETKYGSEFQNDFRVSLNWNLIPNEDRSVSADLMTEFKFGHVNSKFKTITVHAVTSTKRSVKENSYKSDFKGDLQLDDQKFSGILATKLGDKMGKISGQLQVPHQKEPFQVNLGYKYDISDKHILENGEVSMKLDYDKEKRVELVAILEKPSMNEFALNLNLLTPVERAKDIKTRFWHKRSSNGMNYNTELTVTADGKTYKLNNELIVSETVPSIDLKLNYPDGQQSRIFAHFNRISVQKREFSGELNVVSITGFNLIVKGDANLQSVDDFHIKLLLNSEMLGWKDLLLQADNKKGSADEKMIKFVAKDGDKVLISGKTNYQARKENGKLIVEGSGSFEMKGETKSANFKYIRKNLDLKRDGEQGIDIMLNTAFGNKGLIGELKITNKQFRVLNSYCEEKKECAHIEIYSKTNEIDLTEFNHELEVSIDLKTLGLSHEFGLKSVTNRKNFIIDHTVDMHFQSPESSKYQYSVYLHANEAGVVLTLPKRVVALESTFSAERSKKSLIANPIRADVTFYMNKAHEPEKKTVLSTLLEFDNNHNAGNAKGELKLVGYGLQKDMALRVASNYDILAKLVDFNADIDVFDKKSDKIQLTGKIALETGPNRAYKRVFMIEAKSKGLNLIVNYQINYWMNATNLGYSYKMDYSLDNAKYNSLTLIDMRPNYIEAKTVLLNQNLLIVKADIDFTKSEQNIDIDLQMIGLKQPIVSHLELKNFNTFIASVHKKDTPGKKLQTSGGLIIGQIADFRIETIMGGGSKEDVLHASINLDEANFLKSDYGFNADRAKVILQMLQRDINDGLEEVKVSVEKFEKDMTSEAAHIFNVMEKHVPNIEPLLQYYREELVKMRNELVSDQVIQQMADFFKNVFGAIIQTFSEVVEKIRDITEKFISALKENYRKVHDVFTNDFIPELRRIVQKLLDVTITILHNVTDMVLTCLIKIADILKLYQVELNQLAIKVSESFQDFGRVAAKSFIGIREELLRLLNNLYDELKALPFVEFLREKLENFDFDLKPSEYIMTTMDELVNTLKEMIPCPEGKEFVSTLYSYVVKKLKREKIDDWQEIKNIAASFAKAVESVLSAIKSSDVLKNGAMKFLQNFRPTSYWSHNRFPLLNNVKYNPKLQDYLLLLLNHPSEVLHPFNMYAAVVQGQQILTFDRKHLLVPRKCGVILVTDSLDHNFTIYGEFDTKTNRLESLSLLDKLGNSVTLKKDAKVYLNGEATEFPVRTNHSAAYRGYHSVHLASKYGVRVDCTLDLAVCGFIVSGFYHGRLRGLLGNGNNEPFDDMTLSNGKISDNLNEFANSYKVSPNCQDVPIVDPIVNPKPSTVCDQLFGSASDFFLCYPFVNPSPFKALCEQGIQMKLTDTECHISTAYVGMCRALKIPIKIPDKCVKCINGNDEYKLDEIFNMRIPSNMADVVFVLDQNKDYETVYNDLLQPLVTQLTNDLGSKGIKDVNYVLIGYGGGQRRWPSLYTSNGGKVNFNGKTANIKFTDPKTESPYLRTGFKKIDDVIDSLRHTTLFELFDDQIGYKSYRMAHSYPFRPQAAKAIVSFTHDCVASKLIYLARLQILFRGKSDIVQHTLTTVDNLAIKDGGKSAKSIVSFSKTHVQFLDDKKKGVNSNLTSNHLIYERDDMCIDTTLQLDGTVYVAKNFLAAKPGQKKTFVQMFARNLVDDLTERPIEMLDCQCQRYSFLYGRNVCKIIQ